MSKWDKLLTRICSLSKDIRFDELREVMNSYGYEMSAPGSGSSHYTFRKKGVGRLQYQNMSHQENLCGDGEANCGERGEKQ